MPELYGKFTGRPICRKEVSMKRSYGAPQEKAYRTRVLSNYYIYRHLLSKSDIYYHLLSKTTGENEKNRPLFSSERSCG